jgi:CubicO group peptidase (beta-lactamase class C family)
MVASIPSYFPALLRTVLMLLGTWVVGQGDAIVFPDEEWELHPDPAKRGWNEREIRQIGTKAEEIGAAALMIVDKGHLVVDWGRTDTKFKSASMRKSLISALYGIYVEKGIIDLNATIGELGITDKQPLSENERRAKVIDLLQSRSGVYHPAVVATTEPPPRDSHAPGTHWYYNDWDFNVLGTIFEASSGIRIGVAFQEQIASRIDMQDFYALDVSYVYGDQSTHPQYPFLITARDLARFGLLYLADGRWKNEQIIPRKWVERSHRVTELIAKTETGGIGYELLWWQETGKPSAKGLYFAMGGRGQRIYILPDNGLVVIIREDTFAPASDATRVSRRGAGEILELIIEAKGA